MVPAIIISGFRRSGIYPFNPEAIDYGVDDVSKKPTSKKDDSKSRSKASKGEDFNSRSKNLQANAIEFSAEQEKRFQRRYEEGFNIPDPLYLQWLKINHPSEQQADDSITLCDDPGESERNAEAELEELIQQRLEDDQEGLSHVEIVSDEECSDISISNKGPKLPSSSLVQYSSSDEDSACPGPSRLPSVVSHKQSSASTEQHLIENTCTKASDTCFTSSTTT